MVRRGKIIGDQNYERWVFLFSLILMLVLSLFKDISVNWNKFFIGLFALLGLVVGIMNIDNNKDVVIKYLLVFGVLVLFGQGAISLFNSLFGHLSFFVVYIIKFYSYLVYFLTPGAIATALIAIFRVAED